MAQMNLFAGQEQRRRGREQTCRLRGEGQGGMDWEPGINILINVTP